MGMQLKIVEEWAMAPDLDRAIRRGLCRCFPGHAVGFAKSRFWQGSPPAWNVVVLAEEEVIAHAGIVDRTITAGETRLRVAGIQGVFVLPEYSGQGFCGQIMIAAMKEAASRSFDAGLLFCVPRLRGLYARYGWKHLRDATILRIAEDGSVVPLPAENLAMFHPLQLAAFPRGIIHLQGNHW